MPSTRAPLPNVKLRWIVGAFSLMVAIAAVCAYLSLCLLFYQGQWQLLFHPTASVSRNPSSIGLPFEAVSFDTTEAGTPRLSGWWIPGSPGGRTILYLHGGDGSLANTLPVLERLHPLGVNLLAIDYRGFGQSAPLHPSEKSLLQDADASLAYLADLRHLAPGSIVLYGDGVGATIAAEAAVRHREVRAIVLENLTPPAMVTLRADPRTAMLPVRLLMTSPLDPSAALTTIGPARLFLAAPVASAGQTLAAYHRSAPPKALAAPDDLESIRAFLAAHYLLLTSWIPST